MRLISVLPCAMQAMMHGALASGRRVRIHLTFRAMFQHCVGAFMFCVNLSRVFRTWVSGSSICDKKERKRTWSASIYVMLWVIKENCDWTFRGCGVIHPPLCGVWPLKYLPAELDRLFCDAGAKVDLCLFVGTLRGVKQQRWLKYQGVDNTSASPLFLYSYFLSLLFFLFFTFYGSLLVYILGRCFLI